MVGVPEVIDYDDRARRRKHEFEVGALGRVGCDDSVNVQDIEVVIERKDDGAWRVTQEHVLSEDAYAFDPRRNDA